MTVPLLDLPPHHTIDFIDEPTSRDYDYHFRKVYLPSAIIRLANGGNLIGDGVVHMTCRGIVGYNDAGDYFHGSPWGDQTLASIQGFAGDIDQATDALATLHGGDLPLAGVEKLPDIAQVVGIRVGQDVVTNHNAGKFFTVNTKDVPTHVIDPLSRMGLFRLLGEPALLQWFVEDIDPALTPELKLRHMQG